MPLSDWAVQVLVPILIAILGSGWVGDWLKAAREKKSGKVSTNTILEAVQNLKSDLDGLRAELDDNKAVQARVRILRFNDELLTGIKHSKDAFDQAILDCRFYKNYVHNHEDFVNGVADMAIEHIENRYRQCEKERSFL